MPSAMAILGDEAEIALGTKRVNIVFSGNRGYPEEAM